uniref:Uncharacterized protein n=1 Tax=Arundo donax TaxID=35708 RepID=A0A0A9B4R9_ARUDO
MQRRWHRRHRGNNSVEAAEQCRSSDSGDVQTTVVVGPSYSVAVARLD